MEKIKMFGENLNMHARMKNDAQLTVSRTSCKGIEYGSNRA
jgi:hypothetical protein